MKLLLNKSCINRNMLLKNTTGVICCLINMYDYGLTY